MPIHLDRAGLCALDVVYDAGNPLLLEQRVRSKLALPYDAPLARAPEAGWPSGTRAFFEIVELAAALRALLANARPALPSDFARPADATTRSPSRSDLAATLDRATLAQGGLRAAAAAVGARLAVSPLDESALWVAVETLAAYGVVTPTVRGEQLSVLATAAQAEASRRVEAAEPQLQSARSALGVPDTPEARLTTHDAITAAGQTLFGDGFWIVPEIEAPAEPDLWQNAFARSAPRVRPGAIRRFLADFSAVREAVKRASDALLLIDALGQPSQLRVAQLAPAGALTAETWIGGKLDPGAPTPQEPVTSAVIYAAPDYDGSKGSVALIIDEWTDVVPVRERREAEAGAPIDERTTSAISFNAQAPSARAPNTLLLAVASGSERWTTESLLQALLETLELAKLRLVTLERGNGPARVLPALYTQSSSLQGEMVLDLRALAGAGAMHDASVLAAYIKE